MNLGTVLPLQYNPTQWNVIPDTVERRCCFFVICIALTVSRWNETYRVMCRDAGHIGAHPVCKC